ncbi:MAG: hypothetical protein KBB11_01810 [Bacteroidales bacterium]|jgi:predicted membrane protein|nr:hypothetical protein [Bacteroidales bacterium]HOY39807.1 DUF5668 domain-containing protein [Bacteroidales bacterium]HQP02992.1 DUF5668 domain-containing protein [Bacteroidales bacterium]
MEIKKEYRFTCSQNKKSCSGIKKVTFGLLLVAAGVLLILDRTGLIKHELMQYIFSWQSLLIALGIWGLSGFRAIAFHLMLIATGGFFLYAEIVKLPIETQHIFWPVVLVFVGLIIIFKKFNIDRHRKRMNENTEISSQDFIEKKILLSGDNSIITSKNFQGGNISAVLGGCELNMEQAEMAEGNHILNISAVLGGINIIVPKHWDVIVEVDGVLGGFKDERKFVNTELIDRSRRLFIRGSAVMGGGEVKYS